MQQCAPGFQAMEKLYILHMGVVCILCTHILHMGVANMEPIIS